MKTFLPSYIGHFVVILKAKWFRFMVLNATFNNISVILWRSVLLVDETGVPGENHRPVAGH
jgi:predicted permease